MIRKDNLHMVSRIMYGNASVDHINPLYTMREKHQHSNKKSSVPSSPTKENNDNHPRTKAIDQEV